MGVYRNIHSKQPLTYGMRHTALIYSVSGVNESPTVRKYTVKT